MMFHFILSDKVVPLPGALAKKHVYTASAQSKKFAPAQNIIVLVNIQLKAFASSPSSAELWVQLQTTDYRVRITDRHSQVSIYNHLVLVYS